MKQNQKRRLDATNDEGKCIPSMEMLLKCCFLKKNLTI